MEPILFFFCIDEKITVLQYVLEKQKEFPKCSRRTREGR